MDAETFMPIVGVCVGVVLLARPESHVREVMKRVRFVNDIGGGDGSIWILFGSAVLLFSILLFIFSKATFFSLWIFGMSLVLFYSGKVARKSDPLAMRGWFLLLWVTAVRVAGLAFIYFGLTDLYSRFMKH